MEVHPPDHPLHTWRDFFIHIATIVVGLLIAIALEQSVEVLHHHHLLHTAEANIATELRENRKYVDGDEMQLDKMEQVATTNIALIEAARAHKPVDAKLKFYWAWNGPQQAAWETARNTGAIGLMSYEDAQRYNVLYGQTALVQEQGITAVKAINNTEDALQGGYTLTGLTPAQLDALLAAEQHAITEIQYTRMLAQALDIIYAREDKQRAEAHH